MHFTPFDFAVFAILGISAILSFYRGLVREMLSLGAWVGAGIFTLYAFPSVAVRLGHSIHNQTIASGFAALLTFLGALIAISMLGRLLLKFVKSGPDIGLLDNGMGLLFGLARGALVIAIGYFIFTIAVPKEKDYPDWMKGAISRPYVAHAALVVSKMAPSYLEEIAGTKRLKVDKDSVHDAIKSITPEEDVANDLADTLPENEEKSTTDWPSPADLKQRVMEMKKDK